MNDAPAPARLTAADAAAALLAAQEAGEEAAVLLVVEDPAATGGGRRLLVGGGPVTGTLGDAALDEAALALLRRALAREVPEGRHVLSPAPGRSVDVYVELHVPPAELVIVGGGHIAQPLCAIGALLGFRVLVLDDRPEFAAPARFPEAARVERVDFSDPFAKVPLDRRSHLVLVTRGHKYDYECLRRALATDPPPAYIGMIGSRRRVRATFVQLVREGFERERVAAVRAPVGLDLGSQTPAEIAVSVAAEIILLRKGGSGRPLRDLERVVERFIREEGKEE